MLKSQSNSPDLDEPNQISKGIITEIINNMPCFPPLDSGEISPNILLSTKKITAPDVYSFISNSINSPELKNQIK